MTEADVTQLLEMADEWEGCHCRNWRLAAAELRGKVAMLGELKCE